jgi:metal-responsive CopG/Arc/MetJ family transcriptional regulator
MTTAKTAISLDSALLEQTDRIAKKIGTSRSGVIALALQKYFHEIERQEILNQLNEVYEDESNSDLKLTEVSKNYFASNIVERETEW